MWGAILIFIIYVVILFTAYKLFGKGVDKKSVDSFLFADNDISGRLLTPSIFNGWIWTTTIIGAAEAGITYGFIGGFSYGMGAGLAFLLFTGLVLKLRKIMPEKIFVTDYIGKRYSEKTRIMYYILSITIVLYIQIEMSAGLGFVFYGLYDVPFKFVAMISVGVAITFVLISGMKRILYNDLVNFLIIVTGLAVLSFIIIQKYDTSFLYDGMMKLHSSDSESGALAYFTVGGLRYFIVAVFVALAQLTVDPSYYIRAKIAADEKTVRKSFLLGGVFLFIPVAILSGIIFGSTSVALGVNTGGAGNSSVLIASRMIIDNFPYPVHLLMGIVLTAIAMTTLITSLMGIMSLATLDIYPRKLSRGASESDRLKFGKIFTAMIGIIGGLIAISLENISLLTMDVFCGIVFSAAFGVLIVGFFSDKKVNDLAVLAMILGATAGVSIWLIESDTAVDWFYGTLISFIVPVIFILLAGVFVKDRFNIHSLKM